MDEFLGGLLKTNPALHNLEPEDLFQRFGIAFLLGCLVAIIYWLTQRADSPASRGFVTTLVLLSILIAIVTQVVGESGARAFSLVGILSIVRFRTVVEDSRDTAFVIFAVMVGMASGFANYEVAWIGFAVVASAALILRYMPKFTPRSDANWLLQLRISTGAGGATPWDAVFAKCCDSAQLQGTATAQRGASLDLTYKVKLKKTFTPMQLLNEINRIEGIQNLEIKREN